MLHTRNKTVSIKQENQTIQSKRSQKIKLTMQQQWCQGLTTATTIMSRSNKLQ